MNSSADCLTSARAEIVAAGRASKVELAAGEYDISAMLSVGRHRRAKHDQVLTVFHEGPFGTPPCTDQRIPPRPGERDESECERSSHPG